MNMLLILLEMIHSKGILVIYLVLFYHLIIYSILKRNTKNCRRNLKAKNSKRRFSKPWSKYVRIKKNLKRS